MTHLGFTIVTRWGVLGGGIIWAGCKVGHGSIGSTGSIGSVTRSWVHECDPLGGVRRGVVAKIFFKHNVVLFTRPLSPSAPHACAGKV
jgi:hypothetical protein